MGGGGVREGIFAELIFPAAEKKKYIYIYIYTYMYIKKLY